MLKIVKDSVLKVSRSFGYDIVPLREMKERDFALHLRELLARLEIDCVLDVGANAGQYYDFLRDRVLYDGAIISFEPLSAANPKMPQQCAGPRMLPPMSLPRPRKPSPAARHAAVPPDDPPGVRLTSHGLLVVP